MFVRTYWTTGRLKVTNSWVTITSEEMCCHHKSQSHSAQMWTKHICSKLGVKFACKQSQKRWDFQADLHPCSILLEAILNVWVCTLHYSLNRETGIKTFKLLKMQNVFSVVCSLGHVFMQTLTKHDFWSGLMHLQIGPLKVSSPFPLKASEFLFNLSDTGGGFATVSWRISKALTEPDEDWLFIKKVCWKSATFVQNTQHTGLRSIWDSIPKPPTVSVWLSLHLPSSPQ